MNVFVKQNDQSQVYLSSGMARKGQMETNVPLPLYYQAVPANDSLLRNDSLLFRTPVCYPAQAGMSVREIPSTLQHDYAVSNLLMGCMLVLLLVLGQCKRQFRSASSRFFFPTTASTIHPVQQTFGEYVGWYCLYGLLIVALTFISLICADRLFSADLLIITPPQLFVLYLATSAAFFMTKWGIYRLVHWVFFSRQQNRQWLRHAAFVYGLEGIMLFTLISAYIFLHLPYIVFALSVTFVLLFVKILLIAKAQSIFFSPIHRSLHLFVYLCALEIAPCLVLWAYLIALTHQLVPHL